MNFGLPSFLLLPGGETWRHPRHRGAVDCRGGLVGRDSEGTSFGDLGAHGRLSLSDEFREWGWGSRGGTEPEFWALPLGPVIADCRNLRVEYLVTVRACCLEGAGATYASHWTTQAP